MEYIKEGFTLPVPINMIPTSSAIIDFVKAIRRRINKNQNSTRANSVSHTAFDDGVSQYELKSQVSGGGGNNCNNINTIDLPPNKNLPDKLNKVNF